MVHVLGSAIIEEQFVQKHSNNLFQPQDEDVFSCVILIDTHAMYCTCTYVQSTPEPEYNVTHPANGLSKHVIGYFLCNLIFRSSEMDFTRFWFESGTISLIYFKHRAQLLLYFNCIYYFKCDLKHLIDENKL